jgi:hypothetical protein
MPVMVMWPDKAICKFEPVSVFAEDEWPRSLSQKNEYAVKNLGYRAIGGGSTVQSEL